MSSNTVQPSRLAYALLLIATLAWGLNAVVGKLGVGHISPMMMTDLRWGIAALAALPFTWRYLARDWPVIQRYPLRLAAYGVVGFACFNAAMYSALNHTAAVNVVIEQAGVTAGDFVAITGPGPVGLFSALVALAEGGTVVLCGTSRDAERLKLAEELGVHHVIDIEACDPIQRVRELTGGYGADVVVECAGVAPAMRLALDLVRKRGRYSQMGLPGEPVEIDFEKIAYNELQVSGGIGQRRPAWKRALRLMEGGVIPSDKLITHHFALSEWQGAFDMAEGQEGIKLMFMPQG